MGIQYSYLGYSLIFLLVWVIFYILRPDVHRRMLIFSLIIMPLGPLSEFWFLQHYWRWPTITGYLVLVLLFLVYKGMQVIFPSAIEYWCMGCNPSGLRISGINIEELLWDFSWGLAGSTMVEVITGK